MTARKLTAALGGRWQGSYGIARCLCHDDQTPSLSIRDGDDSILLTCYAGCARTAIDAALRRLRLWIGKPAEFERRPSPAKGDTSDHRHRAPFLAADSSGTAGRTTAAVPASLARPPRELVDLQ